MAALDSTANAKTGKRKRSIPRMDMTPMVDLAFLLLTFFVMTTTLSKGYALQIQKPAQDPSGKTHDIKGSQVLNLVLGKNDEVYWYTGSPGTEASRTDFSSTGVRKLLLQKNREIKGLHVFIKSSDASRYQNTIDVLDEITITQVANYSMVELEAEDLKLVQ